MRPRSLLALVSAMIVVAGIACPVASQAESRSGEAVAWLKSKGLYEPLRARIESARYAIRPSAGTEGGDPGHEAENPAQGLRSRFTDAGVEVAPRPGKTGSWRWSMRLDAYGHGDGLERVATPDPSASGDRVEYRYGRGLTEWYVNTARGIEQGFTLDEPAPGAGRAGRPLELVLALSGDLSPRMSGRGDAIELASADGTAVLGYRDLVAWDARGRILPSRMALAAGQIRLIVDAGGAEYPVTVDPLVFGSSSLIPENGKADDAFGFSVAISGNVAVVGAPSRETGPGVFKGAAFVFVLNGTKWVQEAELRPSDASVRPEEADLFGFGVAISGTTIVIGAPGNTPADQKTEAGAAYVFVKKVVKQTVTWSQQAKIAASDGAAHDGFGFSVALSGDIAVIGAPDHDPGGKPLAGTAYVFGRSGVAWTERARLNSGAEAGDRLGHAVALTDGGGNKTVVVGAPALTASGKTGRVSVFFGSGTSWPKQADLLPSPNDLQPGDAFGYAVGISENTAVVGAPAHNPGGAVQGGQVYVFARAGTTWKQQAKLGPAPSDETDGDLFGSAVDIDKDLVVAGSPFRPPSGSGQAYVFIRTGTTWVEQTQQLRADPPGPFQFFGFAVAISGTNVAVGAPFHDASAGPAAGPAYVFAPTVSFVGVWVGLQDSDDVGLRLDLRAEVFKGGIKVAEGQINDVGSGSIGFNNAILQTIPLELPGSVPSYTSVTVSVRVSCSGSGGHSTGIARLWYNGRFVDSGSTRDAGSRVEIELASGVRSRSFLRKINNALQLNAANGVVKEFIDRSVDSSESCSGSGRSFTPFGTFSFPPSG